MKRRTLLLASFFLLSCLPARAGSSSPMDLLQEGLEAMMDDRYEDAAKAFESVLQYDAGNEAAQRGLKGAQKKVLEQLETHRAQEKPALETARKAMGRGDWPEAAEKLAGILSRQPGHPEATVLRDKVRARMTKQMQKSRTQSGDWYYAQGVLSYMDRDWLKAVDSWDHVVSFDPDQVALVAKMEQAKENLRAAESEEKVRFYNAVAFDGLKNGDYAGAIRNWKGLLVLDPDNAQAHSGLAEAQKAWDDKKRRDRQDEIQRLSELAMDAYVEQNRKKSLEIWNQVLALDPENTLAKDYIQRLGKGGAAEGGSTGAYGFEKALTFLADGRYPEAMEYLERFVEKYPDDKKAKATLDEARAKQKSLADKAYQDGLMAYSQGDTGAAISLWQAALRADPDYQRARQAIIKAMAEERKRREE